MGETAMNTKKELNALKEEVETESKQRRELTDEELAQVFGGNSDQCDGCEYNSNGVCRSYRTIGQYCPHGYA